MEATAVSVGKAVLDGALGYAKSKAAEEIALQLGVERDVDFIKDELQMMQSFLMTADEEQSQDKVLTTWVKQVGVLAYKVEDSLMDFGLYSEKKPFLGCIPRNPWDQRRIAKEVKELRAKVEDVSNRNLRYRLIKDGSGSKRTASEEQASIATAAMFAAVDHDSTSNVDLHQLITSDDVDLRVIAVWGNNGDLGKTSVIHEEVYDHPKVLERFGFCAWVRLMHPFNPQEFLRSVVKQFYESSDNNIGKAEQETSVGANVLAKMEKMNQSDLVHAFNKALCNKSYLVVINDLATIEEWHCIKKYFPDNKKQSRIVVSTQQAEIARLCTEKPYQVSEFKQLSCDQTIYLFHKKNSEEHVSAGNVSVAMSDNNDEAMVAALEKENPKAMHASCSIDSEKNSAVLTNEIQKEDQEPNNAGVEKVHNSTARKKFDRSRTLALGDEVLCGRETEESALIKLIGRPDDNERCKVISVCGMGGLGKTTLVRSIYRSRQLGGWKRAWATALRPFNAEVLLKDLALQLQKTIQEDPAGSKETGAQKQSISVMNLQDLKEEVARLLNTKRCLVVLDDISSISEWELVKSCLDNAGRIIVTTREKNIAKHCSTEYKNMYCLEGLANDAALDLFIKKVFMDNTEKKDVVPHTAMMEQARRILGKCDGLPLAISTIGGFLATKPKTAIEWRKLNDSISTELEINPELKIIKTILMRSYYGLPYHLKSAFLYLSIFPEDHKIRWGRLLRRWIAEGYSRDTHDMTAVELCRRYFDELLDRSMILPGEGMDQYSQKTSSCQLHDMIREICISNAREENLVFTLDERCLSDTQGAIRHLVIGSNWKRDKDVLESMLDLSHLRSMTVFGEWRSFFISDNMRFLRVLDLEDAIGLRDHHLHKIGQLHHLKYLSLRGCRNILYLPKSLQNLRHLQTLDVKGTHIIELPRTITNLSKLQHLHAAGFWNRGHDVKGEDIVDKYSGYRYCTRTCETCSVLLSRGHLFLRPQVLDAGLNRYDIFNLYGFQERQLDGVILPRGIGKLKALHSLGFVDVSGRNGNATVKEFGELTQLHKLKVGGLSYRNINELWSAIAGHNQLQTLSVEIGNPHKERNELDGCLGEGLLPPSSLESLGLHGKLVNVTEWIHKLQNLSKLVLKYSMLEQDDAIQALGVLPNIAVLRLHHDSFKGTQLHFQRSSFLSLLVLELSWLDNLQSVLFEEDTMPKLELLQIGLCYKLKDISGLPALKSLKEIQLPSTGDSGSYYFKIFEVQREEVERQVAEHVRVNIID